MLSEMTGKRESHSRSKELSHSEHAGKASNVMSKSEIKDQFISVIYRHYRHFLVKFSSKTDNSYTTSQQPQPTAFHSKVTSCTYSVCYKGH